MAIDPFAFNPAAYTDFGQSSALPPLNYSQIPKFETIQDIVDLKNKPKTHRGKAALSLILPGTGDLIDEQTGKGLVRLGILASTLLGMTAIGKSMKKTGSSRFKIAGLTTLGIIELANHITSCITASKDKKTKEA
jgi:hypothetical protein